MPTDDGDSRLLEAINAVEEVNPPKTHVYYSWMFCEVCELQYREFLARFEDGSVFTLCHGCVIDLTEVVELFGIAVAITGIRA